MSIRVVGFWPSYIISGGCDLAPELSVNLAVECTELSRSNGSS